MLISFAVKLDIPYSSLKLKIRKQIIQIPSLHLTLITLDNNKWLFSRDNWSTGTKTYSDMQYIWSYSGNSPCQDIE